MKRITWKKGNAIVNGESRNANSNISHKKSSVKTTGIPVRPYLKLFFGYFKQIF